MATPQTLYAYYREALRGVSLPAAYVDLELFDKNVAAIAQRAGQKKIRVATKSLRAVPMIQRILAASTQYEGLMCYAAREALWLAAQGFDDLLVAYPTTNAQDIAAVAQAVGAGKRIYLMADLVEHLQRLEAQAAAAGVVLPICVDIDLSMPFMGIHFGVHRSSIKSVDDMRRWLDFLVQKCPHLRLAGLMGYEAQIAGLGDRQRGKWLMSRIIAWLQRRSIGQLRERRAACVEAIRGAGIALDFVNGGGTGSLESTREEQCVTEVTAGSGFYSPTLFDQYSRFRHLPAAGFAVEITRQPKAGVYTCLGGGYVASGAAGVDKVPLPYLPEGCKLDSNEQCGEVQTPIYYTGTEKLAIGDPVLLRHAKAGELCERFERLYLIEKGGIVGEAKTYRGEGQCFL